jgi:hypothetical protein
VPSCGTTLREYKTDIAAIVERQEKDPVSLTLQKTAEPDIEALFVALHSPTDGRVKDKSDAFALTDLFDGPETQHDWTSSLNGQAAYEGLTSLLRIRFSGSPAYPKGWACSSPGSMIISL